MCAMTSLDSKIYRTAEPEDTLIVEAFIIQIGPFGTVEITRGPDGPHELQPFDTALVPSFHTSVVVTEEVHGQERSLEYRERSIDISGSCVFTTSRQNMNSGS